jgi:hypothetical protein
MRLFEFFYDPEGGGDRPEDNYPCYDCGSTILGHHTKLCDLAEEWAIHDLPAQPGTQYWTGQVPKGLKPIAGLEENINTQDNHSDTAIHSAIRHLLPIAMQELNINEIPKISIKKKLNYNGQPSFGSFSNGGIELGIDGRHPVDVCRTLAHELVHYKQGKTDRLDAESGNTGSPEENQANSVAGIIMRKFSKQYPQYIIK